MSAVFLLGCAACASGGSQPAASGSEGGGEQAQAQAPAPPRKPRERGGGGRKEIEEAKKLAGDGNLDGAIAKVQAAIAINPNIEEAYLLLGSTCAMKEDDACEKEAYVAGSRAFPTSAALLNELGLFKLRTGDVKGAIADLERAHELTGKKDAKVMADLAYGYIFVERLDEAAALAESARKIDKQSIEAAMSHGEVLLRKRDGAGAAEAFTAALALTSDAGVKANLNRQLGLAFTIAGDFEKALATYRSLEAVAGDDPLLHAQIANALMQLGRPKEAVVEMEKAVKLAPEDPRYSELLKQAQEKAGDKKGSSKGEKPKREKVKGEKPKEK